MRNFLFILFLFSAQSAWLQHYNSDRSGVEIVRQILEDPVLKLHEKSDKLHTLIDPPIWTKLSDEEFAPIETKLKAQLDLAVSYYDRYHLNIILMGACNQRGDVGKSIMYAENCLRIAREMGDKQKELDVTTLIMWVYFSHDMYQQLMPYSMATMRLTKELNMDSSYAEAVGTHGYILMQIADETGDPLMLDSAINCLKYRYDYLSTYKSNSFPEATIVYTMALARSGEREKAIEVAQVGYASTAGMDDSYWRQHYRARFAQQIGNYYAALGQRDSAFHYIYKCLALDAPIRDTSMTGTFYSPYEGFHVYSTNLIFLINAYEAFGEYEQALKYLDVGLKTPRFKKDWFYSVYVEAAAQINYELKNYEKASRYFMELNQLKDSLNQDEVKRYIEANAAHTESQILQEKKMAELEQEKQQLITQQEKEKRTLITIVFTVGAIVLVVLLTFIYRRFKITSKQKKIIESQKVIVEKAYDELDEKNKEITDSIKYAKRIQAAILPSDKVIKHALPDSFVLYKPKDIVAGDFYWLQSSVASTTSTSSAAAAAVSNFEERMKVDFDRDSKVPEQLTLSESRSVEGTVLFAAADCTGHGVPGALVSVVCNNALNRSVREFGLTDPGKILDKTREIVIAEFEKSDENVKDGMDISLCTLSLSTLTLTWAGANNPLWIIRNGAWRCSI